MKSKTFLVISLLFIGFVLFCRPAGGNAEKLTVDLLFDRNMQDKLRTPEFEWLNNSKALLLDYQIEPFKRTLEIFDPQTQHRFPAIDRKKVLPVLQHAAVEEVPASIPWPDAIDPNGKAIVYDIEGNLFCVELSSSNVKLLTKASSSETSATFSPDGKWVSFTRDSDIFAIDWRAGTEKRLTTGGTESLINGTFSWVYWEEIYDRTSLPYRWSPDSSAIAYLQTDDSPVSISTYVNFEPATQEVIRQRYPKAGQTNPKARLGIVNLRSPQTTWVDCGEYEYLARFKWLPNSKEIAVQTLNRQQSELKLFISNAQSGTSREILVERQPAWINLNDTLYFLEDEDGFIWQSERNGYQHLYLYQKDGTLIRPLTQGDFMVMSSAGELLDRDQGLVGVDEESAWVYFTANKHALKERHLYRINLDGTGLQKLSQEEGVHAANFSPCMKYYLNTYSSASNPPELSLFKPDGNKIAEIVQSARGFFDKFNINSSEFHTFETEDGLHLPAMMTKPAHFDQSKKYPAIVYVYGGPGSQQVVDRWRDRWIWHGLLSQEGFFVFVFEVRSGMGKSKALETSVYKRAYGIQNVKDILAGVRWIEDMPYIDAERLGIWGWSGGGCTTLFTITHSDVFKAAISVAPVSDWHFYDTTYTERYQSTPQDNPKGYVETSSVLAASNMKGKLLIVHGTYDDNVHPQNTFAFIHELIEHNIPFESMIYPWRKHGISDTPAQIHLYNLMLDFWKRRLK